MKNKSKKSVGLRLVYSLMLFLNIIVAVFLLLGAFSPNVNPCVWVFPSYMGLVFPVILVINVCFLLFWAIVRRPWFFFALAVILLAYFPTKNTFGLSVKHHDMSDKSDRKIVVLSYNTMSLGKYAKHTDEGATNRVLDYIVAQDADVVCLQEFAVSKSERHLTWQDVSGCLEKYPYRHVSYRINNSARQVGVATFSKYPIVNKQLLDFESVFNMAHYSDIVINGDTIRFFNNHLESNRLTEKDIIEPTENTLAPDFLSSYAGRVGSKLAVAYRTRAKQADLVAREISKSPYKVVVCGDFNDVPVSYTYKTIRGNLEDAFVNNHFCSLGNSFEESWLRVRIDYILYDPSMSSAHFAVDKVKYSDHYPVHCELVL